MVVHIGRPICWFHRNPPSCKVANKIRTLRKYCSFQAPGAPSWGCTPLTPQGLLPRDFNLSSFGATGIGMDPFATKRRQQRGQEINRSGRNPWQELWIVREVRPDACDAFLGGNLCGAWVPAVWNRILNKSDTLPKPAKSKWKKVHDLELERSTSIDSPCNNQQVCHEGSLLVHHEVSFR